MRRDVAADLQHDLGARSETECAWVAAATLPTHVHGNRTSEGREPTCPKGLAPDAEEAAQRPPTFVVNDATWIERPKVRAATCAHDTTKAKTGPFEPDRRGDDHNTPPGEQLEVNTRTGIEWRRVADKARRRRPRRWLIARSRSHRRRHDPQHDRHGPKRQGTQVHRPQAMRIVLCLLVCALAAGVAAPFAKADGDPASDYLISQKVFLSYDAKIPSAFQRKLLAAVESANRNGYPVRVALIWSSYDLGSVPVLFAHPRQYARFLDAEDAKCWWGASCSSGRFSSKTRLLVVMPNGLGFAQWKHNPAAGYRMLAGIEVERTPAGLATAATTAVVKLAAAAGVKASTSGGPALADQSSSGTSRVVIIVAVVGAILLGVAALLLVRRRAARSAVR
jgi:hypothetical protein